ncbi:MAG TPA: L,D-transpeptidase [Tenuifilaceae bacterium]|nr:L,D-transpeptidase [Tenuifilaceae bacterium]HPJ46973.1 L,D-transpeptidase [Tenuifilaceae bacterium]HPQ35452.1 L,D-transpeptidase [Tenuifilaceae bacterium]HRX69203.1 L,D-transpeptidase [Tenuifilaceae bacterium]
MRLIILNIFLCITLNSCGLTNEGYLNYRKPLKEILDSLNVNDTTLSVLVDKSEYKLSILSGTQIIKEYPVVFGGNPKDDKLMQGDECTPEGTFYIVSKYPHRTWSKFIWINYPTADSWKKHNQAKREGAIPQNAKIGGEIGIHGVPTGLNYLIDVKYNWTLGCISLKNSDVNEIYPYITGTTKIVIQK